MRITVPRLVHAISALPEYEECFGHDQRYRRLVLLRRPPFEHVGPTPCFVTEAVILGLVMDLDAREIPATTATCWQAVKIIAQRNQFDRVHDYLRGLEWDGIRRLVDILVHYFGAEDTEFVRLVGRMWMIGAVARALKPGEKMDNVLVLEGSQGEKKGSALNALAGDFYLSSPPKPYPNETRFYTTVYGPWIIELAELEKYLRTADEASAMKDMLSKTHDRYKPYGSTVAEDQARNFVFAGTTNQFHYLRDSTGNRRYWPVSMVHAADVSAIERDRDQLWAEAVEAYKQGERWWLTDAERENFQAEQQERVFLDPFDLHVVNLAKAISDSEKDVTTEQLCELVSSTQFRRRATSQYVGAALKKNGWGRRKERKKEGGYRYVYDPPSQDLNL